MSIKHRPYFNRWWKPRWHAWVELTLLVALITPYIVHSWPFHHLSIYVQRYAKVKNWQNSWITKEIRFAPSSKIGARQPWNCKCPIRPFGWPFDVFYQVQCSSEVCQRCRVGSSLCRNMPRGRCPLSAIRQPLRCSRRQHIRECPRIINPSA